MSRLRILGALALLGVGLVHGYEFFAHHYEAIPTIGPLFILNFAGAVVIVGFLLVAVDLVSTGAGRFWGPAMALLGVGLSVLSIAFLVASQSTRLFGFAETGYRTSMYLALVFEALTTILLSAYALRAVRRIRRQGHSADE